MKLASLFIPFVVLFVSVFVACDGDSSTQTSNSSSLQKLDKHGSVCVEQPACDAMVKSDISALYFVYKSVFGDDAEYIYKADDRDLVVTIKGSLGSTDVKTYSMYNMESEVGLEMAFCSAKATRNSLVQGSKNA